MKYSKEYLEWLRKIIQNKFGLSSIIRKKKAENTYELIITSKWLGRFYHNMYDIPLGYKYDKLRVPSILFLLPKNEQKQKLCLFWRGVFDTDGSVSNHLEIILGSKSKSLLNNLVIFLQKLNVNCSRVRPAFTKNNYYISILRDGYYSFATKIGLSNPRKIRNLIFNLQKGPVNRIFKGVRKESFYYGYYDLSLIKEYVRIAGAENLVKKLIKQLLTKYNKTLLSKMLGYKFWNSISRYQRGERKIPLRTLIRLAELCGHEKLQIYKWLEELKIKFYPHIGGKGKIPCKLPLRYKDDILPIIKYLKPDFKSGIIRVSTSNYCPKRYVIEKIKKIFGLKIKKDHFGCPYTCSKVLALFLKAFYIFEIPWQPIDGNKADRLISTFKKIF